MNTYLLYIHDRRYSVPTMDVITAGGDERAKALAADRLASSADYFAAELWEDERLVARLDKPAGYDPERRGGQVSLPPIDGGEGENKY